MMSKRQLNSLLNSEKFFSQLLLGTRATWMSLSSTYFERGLRATVLLATSGSDNILKEI